MNYFIEEVMAGRMTLEEAYAAIQNALYTMLDHGEEKTPDYANLASQGRQIESALAIKCMADNGYVLDQDREIPAWKKQV